MTTNSDNINNNSHSPNEQMQWPRGENCQFLILPVTVSSKVMIDAQSFISGNCYYYDKEEIKRKPCVIGVDPGPQIVSKAIQMEALFTEAAGRGTDDSNLMDYQRFQTNPSRQTSLLKSPAIAAIVSATQCMIDSQVTGYSMYKLSVLYSVAGGNQQGLHVDDTRATKDQERDGELLSVIFSLWDNTKLDIARNHEQRKTYSIPSGAIFLFSGNCRHGGSAYMTNNIRIHMFFGKRGLSKNMLKENKVPFVFNCPIKDCAHNQLRRRSFTKSQLYDHWRNVHKSTVGISVGKYIKYLQGGEVLQCQHCNKGFTTDHGLRRHQRSRCAYLKKTPVVSNRMDDDR